MKSLFHRHRVRATFYHMIAIIFLVSTGLWLAGILSDTTCFYISSTLFLVDYIAEMYDPHPDTPGPWFKAHFHRLFDGGEEDEARDSLLAKAVRFKTYLMTAPEEKVNDLELSYREKTGR